MLWKIAFSIANEVVVKEIKRCREFRPMLRRIASKSEFLLGIAVAILDSYARRALENRTGGWYIFTDEGDTSTCFCYHGFKYQFYDPLSFSTVRELLVYPTCLVSCAGP